MSEATEAPLWVPQGWYGPMPAAQAAYAATVIDGTQVGALIPLEGGPTAVDEAGEDGMFAVLVRPDNPLPTPPGMKAARADMVLRMVGAG